MRKFAACCLRFFIPAALIFLSFGAISAAADPLGPAQTLTVLLDRIKQQKSLLAVIDDVDWEGAFKRFPKDLKVEHMPKIQNSEDMKTLFIKSFASPEDRYSDLTHNFKNAPPADQEELRKNQQDIIRRLRDEQQRGVEKIEKSTFTVGAETIDGERAKVQLTTERDGVSLTKQVGMVHKDGRWLLESPGILGKKGATQSK